MASPHGIRRARPEEAAAISDLALRSKGHWGYDSDFLEACRPVLTLAPEDVANRPVFVAESDGRLAGFYGLTGEPPAGRLEYLYVAPEAIGGGVGKRLFRHARAYACRLGFDELELEADPNAEAFYLHMGAERIGEVPSTVRSGRMLPLMRVRLDG